MAKRKRTIRKSPSPNSYWNLLSDEQLLAATLTTEDPEGLENLVTEIPEGDKEPYVEFSYDYRGSDHQRLHCVHEHHSHLSGFVMNKGGKRFLVGRICGVKIYHENFEQYTTDFDAARVRKDALHRDRKIKDAIGPFLSSLDKTAANSDVFGLYLNVRDQFINWMPWLHEQLRIKSLKHAGKLTLTTQHTPLTQRLLCELPTPTFFEVTTRPDQQIKSVVNDLHGLCRTLVTRFAAGESVEITIARTRQCLNGLEAIFEQLAEVENLFQPATLSAVAEWANANDNSKRTYQGGLTHIKFVSNRGDRTVKIPENYRVPDRSPISAFRAALAGLPSL